jgi:phosphoribosyl 1,2-cyclic phosphodiesterase
MSGNTMQIRFWGVRGSVASPGPATLEVGGNTSCVEVRCSDRVFAFDAGTGLRSLGESLLREGRPVELTLMLSHLHWDHIQGMPFFAPIYVPTSRIEVVGARSGGLGLEDALARQMSAPGFPVTWAELRSSIACREIRPGESFDRSGMNVRTARLNHPGGVVAYRIEWAGKSVVYATDTEHYACLDPALVALAKGADVLIYDAQYMPDEYRGERGFSRVGWGHSTWEVGCATARAAGVNKLVLFHHDPSRDDAAVAEIERLARSQFADVVAAREGATIDLGTEGRERAA